MVKEMEKEKNMIVIVFLLKFEGEYLNGKRNGKGIEYWIDGDLIFEGEYLDGIIWNGKGKGKYGFNSIFEGEYLNGKEWNNKRIL